MLINIPARDFDFITEALRDLIELEQNVRDHRTVNRGLAFDVRDRARKALTILDNA